MSGNQTNRPLEAAVVVLTFLSLVASLRAGEIPLSLRQPRPGRTNVLSFPRDRWIGYLYLESESGLGLDRRGGRLSNEWEHLGAAQGEVLVPQDRSIVLAMTLALSPREAAKLQAQEPRAHQMQIADRVRKHPSDLSGLSQLDANDLFALTVGSPMYQRTGAAPAVFEPIRRLTGLRVLRLQSTGVTDAGLECLRPLRSLKALEITQFSLGNRWLAILKDLSTLEHLDLNTGVTDAGLKEVAKASSLRSLRLTHGNIWGPGLAELAKLPHLELLCIHTKATDRHIQYLEGLTRLRVLSFWYVEDTLTDASLASIAKLKNLEELYFVMSAPKFTPAGVARLKDLPNLRVVDFGMTWVRPEAGQYGDEVARELAAFPRLESVERLAYLSADGLKTLATRPRLKCLDVTLKNRHHGYSGPTGLPALASLKSLEELRIQSDDGLSDTDLAALESLGGLKELQIAGVDPAGPGISERGLASIGKLKQLERLTLMTNVTRSGLNRLNGLSNLQSLQVTMAGNLSSFGLTDEATLDLAGLKKMEDMNLTGLPLEDDDLAFLKHLSSLRRLMIQPSCALAERSLRHLRGLPALDNLWVCNLADCTGEDMAHLDELPRLRSLILSGDVPDAALRSLAAPPGLDSLDVRTNAPIRKETVTALACRHPGIEYIHISELPAWATRPTGSPEGRRQSPSRSDRQTPANDHSGRR